jgi:phage protein D
MSEMQLSPLALYSARPTLRIAGRDDATAAAVLQSLVVSEQEGGMSSLEAAFVNISTRPDGTVGPPFEDEQLIKLGAEIKVYAGETAAPTEIFSGLISAIELSADSQGPPRLLLHAEDAAQKARLARRIAVYENQSPADIVRTVAARMGLNPVVSGLTETAVLEVQFNESDLAFLRRLLSRHAADLQIVAGDLQVSPRGDVRRNEVTLSLASQLYRVRAVADLAHQVTEVRVTGFDPAQGESIKGTASSGALGPGSGRDGKSQLQAAFGERVQQTAHRLALTQAEADALAAAEFALRARRFVQLDGACEGNPALRVGTHLKLEQVSPRFDNTYYVTACSHRYDMRRGFETEFSAECAYLGNPA